MWRPGARWASWILAVILVLAAAGCGDATPPPAAQEAVVGAAPTPASGGAASRPAALRDAEASKSFPLPEGVKPTKRAPTPGSLATPKATPPERSPASAYVSPGALSDAQIASELKQMSQVLKRQRSALKSSHVPATMEPDGTAQAPPGVPVQVARVIAGGNAIARYPYVYGGGHGSFVDSAYDCSGSLSYALAAGGLLTSTMTSRDFAKWGAPGPGRYITIFANDGHTFMYVAGLRFDTSGRDGLLGSRWQAAPRPLRGFVERHPPGF